MVTPDAHLEDSFSQTKSESAILLGLGTGRVLRRF